MRRFFRILLHRFYRPLLQRYLRKGRSCRYAGLRLFIPAGVFHPAFFGSTRVMATFLQDQELQGRPLLEIGCGSGLLSLIAAGKGAEVTALDINPAAVTCCRDNAARNGLPLQSLQSDLFDELPARRFDVILSNPPYFDGEPESPAAAAWYTGEGHRFFQRFFGRLPEYTHSGSQVWLILSESCDLEAIKAIARQHRHALSPVFRRRRLFEDFVLFEAQPSWDGEE